MADNAQQTGPVEDTKRNKVFEFSEKHPYILMAVVVVLVLLVGYFFLKDMCWPISKTNKRKKKSSDGDEPGDEKTQIDELIESINRKQAAKAPAADSE